MMKKSLNDTSRADNFCDKTIAKVKIELEDLSKTVKRLKDEKEKIM